MPKHQEKRALPFRPEQLFDLVADIARYPEFLPWCKGARIIRREGNLVTADLIIGYKMFQEKFTSSVTLDPPKRISVQYLSGPLSSLKNEWGFRSNSKGGCDLCFDVEFDFRSRVLGGVIRLAVDLSGAAVFHLSSYCQSVAIAT